MKELLKQILDEMKIKVINNLETVKEYERNIKELSSQPETYARAFNLQMKRKRSRQILNDNLDYLELQLKIIHFIDKYKNSDFLKAPLAPIILKNVDYFKETIEGRIEFNDTHPYFKDESFIEKLINYYLSIEDYVICDKLFKLKEQKNIH